MNYETNDRFRFSVWKFRGFEKADLFLTSGEGGA
jgi:hypothetical protein